MGAGAVVLVVLVVILAGALASVLDRGRPLAQHAVTGSAAALGAVCASLLVYPTGLGGPRADGLLVLPALAGAALVGGLTAAVAGRGVGGWQRRP